MRAHQGGSTQVSLCVVPVGKAGRGAYNPGMRQSVLLALPMVGLVAYAGWVATRGSESAPPETADPLAASWRGVASRPESPDAWLRLAERQLELDQAEAAERSLWTAIELGDPEGLAHARLGFLLYAQHRDDEALALLEIAREREVSLPLLEHTLTLLQDRARESDLGSRGEVAGPPGDDAPTEPESRPQPIEPPPPAPDAGPPRDAGPRPDPGPEPLAADAPEVPCEIPLDRIDGGRTLVIDVDVDGVRAGLILDTGASLTVLTRELVAELGLALDERRSITAITANGRVEMPTAVVGSVVVGERVVRELRVAVCEDCVSDLSDGLLGLDLQTTLEMQIDAGASTLRFGDCGP